MKKANLHPECLADGDQVTLGPVQMPAARQDAAVLVAVAVADHDLLHRRFRALALLLVLEGALHERVRQEFTQDGRAAFQVVDGLEERRRGS